MVFVVLLLGYCYNATLCHTCSESRGLRMLRSSSNTMNVSRWTEARDISWGEEKTAHVYMHTGSDNNI